MKPDNKKRIAVVVLYYGETPWYMRYFVHSCSYNPSVDFLIFSDRQIAIPKNTKNILLTIISFEELRKYFSKKLKIKVALEFPYKICDFRPAFGVIFEDYLQGYDFWGHADADLIFGNIRNFLTPELLSNYDIITMRHDYILGCFTVFRNCKKINTLYKLNRDYLKVFTTARHFCFDETNFSFKEFLQQRHYSQIDSEVESMTHLVRRMQELNYLQAYFDFHIVEGRPGNLKWEKGSLSYRNEYEAMLYHFIKLKSVYHPPVSSRTVPDIFYISPTRIYT